MALGKEVHGINGCGVIVIRILGGGQFTVYNLRVRSTRWLTPHIPRSSHRTSLFSRRLNVHYMRRLNKCILNYLETAAELN